jgi:serine protease inhibitor
MNTTPAALALAGASRTFGLDLTRHLAQAATANVFTSPLSAQLALAMAATGARGTTQRAMLDALGLPGLDGEVAAREANALMARLSASGSVALEIANGLWARPWLALDPAFVHTVRTSFGAEAAALGDTPASINDWASRRTHGMVPFVVDRIEPADLLVLVNATYFHGDWLSPFDAGETRPAPFHRLTGGDVSVPLMHRAGDFTYGEGPDHQAVTLPYGGEVAMLVVLPRGRLATADFAPYLDARRFDAIGADLTDTPGELRLPRFELDVQASLVEPLTALGMGPAFRRGADFSGVAPSCEKECLLSRVAQRARLAVDELGTTAAAATAVVMAGVSYRPPRPPFQMIVDRPFLVAIQHVPTGTLLFAGVVADLTG